MNKLIDLLEETFGYIANLIKETLSLLREAGGNPIFQRFKEDIGKRIGGTIDEILRERKRFQILQVLTIGAIFLFLIFSAVTFQVGNRWDRTSYIINIPKGYSAGEVSELLLEHSLIDGKYGFNLLMNFMRMEGKIQAGTYKLNPNMSLLAIMTKLKRGDIIPPPLLRVSFPEGSSIYKMGETLRKEGISDFVEFKTFAKMPISFELKEKFSFLNEVPIDSLEGYLFPDTYFIPSNIKASLLAEAMLSRFQSQILPFWKRAKKNTRFSFHEVITLASIIEKEAAVDSERPIISSVFHNRLKKRMYLAADPTVKYALSEVRKPTKKVYWIDLEVDSPYNTYKHLGLPPGPICNPGLSSIRAAVYPADTEYLYFVARPDGSHIFSRTWQEHEEARKLIKR